VTGRAHGGLRRGFSEGYATPAVNARHLLVSSPIGFVTSVDVYPRFGSALAGFTEVSLLAQVGL
jgi:hypothetical protein